MEDFDQKEWEEAWRAMPHRRLPDFEKLDWNTIANSEVGEVVDVTFVEVPSRFRSFMFIATNVCPICGELAEEASQRSEIVLYPSFTRFPKVGFGAWAHRGCVELCAQIVDPNPIPW